MSCQDQFIKFMKISINYILLAFITNSPEIKVNQSQTTVAVKLLPTTFVYTPLKIIIMLLLFKTLRALLTIYKG